MKNGLVSIIIPVYNRSHLIGETLDSILNQTYKHWECIVVDDGSSDAITELLEFYTEKDKRIKFFLRPKSLVKGANSCRNFGFKKSHGDFIQWFDSDDIMLPNHIKSKVAFIIEGQYDFIVSKTINFQNSKLLTPYTYEKKVYGIKASDFILLKIHWYTFDVLISRTVAKLISWNEKMMSWQDYNYFCKMVLITENGDYLDEVLTHRRIHSLSIQQILHKSKSKFINQLLENRVLTFLDIQAKLDNYTKKELLNGIMNLSFEASHCLKLSRYSKTINSLVYINNGFISLLYFNLSLILGLVFKKGYFLLQKAKKF